MLRVHGDQAMLFIRSCVDLVMGGRRGRDKSWGSNNPYGRGSLVECT